MPRPISRLRVPDRILILICLMYLVLYMDRVNISTAAGAIQAELHLSNTQLGFVFSAYAYPYALVQLFGGWLGDRFGPRLTLTAAGLVFALATLAVGAAGGLASLVACRFILGLGEAPALPTATRAMATWMPASRRGFAQGVTHAAARAATAVTPPIVALLIGWSSWRGAFLALGAVTLVWVAGWAWYARDRPADHPAVTAEDLAILPPEPRRAARVPVGRLMRRMLPVTVVDFCYAWSLWVYLTWLPSFFLHSYGLDLNSSALFTGGVLCAGIVGDTLGGVWSDRIRRRTGDLVAARRNLVAGGLLAAVLFLVPVLLATDLRIVAPSLTLAFFSMELVIAPLWAVPMDVAPRYAGTASGFMNFGFGVAGIASPLAFGFVIDRTGDWHVPFAMAMGLLVVGAAAAFFMRPDRPFETDADAARLDAERGGERG